MKRLLLKPDEAAEVLGVGRSKIYALLSAGELPSVRVGKSVRVPAAALERWVNERAAEPANTIESDGVFTDGPR